MRAACEAVFAARADEAALAGDVPGRLWPPGITAHDHWPAPFAVLAAKAGLDVSLPDAVAELDVWVMAISQA